MLVMVLPHPNFLKKFNVYIIWAYFYLFHALCYVYALPCHANDSSEAWMKFIVTDLNGKDEGCKLDKRRSGRA